MRNGQLRTRDIINVEVVLLKTISDTIFSTPVY